MELGLGIGLQFVVQPLIGSSGSSDTWTNPDTGDTWTNPDTSETWTNPGT
jgi:hypothetical protein